MKQLVQFIFFLFIIPIFAQQSKYEILNVSVNSEYADLGVTFLNENEVLFASSKKSENDKSFKKDRRKHNQQLYLDFYKALIAKNKDLIQTSEFSKEPNNMIFESDITFTPDYSTIYFTWNNFYNEKKELGFNKWKTLHLVKASINKNYEITNITSLPFNNDNYSLKNPKISEDGSQLFFVSDMPSGYGKTDIYVVEINNDGTYSEPKNLGPTINTTEAELYPFVDNQNTLYFSSNGHKGHGNLDIFKSTFKIGEFQTVENLPAPINSKSDDFALVTNITSNSGYFTSNREHGKGGVDIYTFKKIQIQCEKVILGKILNSLNQEPINNTFVSLFHNDILQKTINTKSNNLFTFNLECDENYKIIAQKDEFTVTELNLSTSNLSEIEISKTILITPINCQKLISGVVLDKSKKQPLRGAVVKIYKLVDSITLDNEANFNLALDCDTNYKIVASHKNYNENNLVINTSNITSEDLKTEILLPPLTDFITIKENKKIIKTAPIYFDLNSSYLKHSSKVELDKVVEIMKKYPNIVIKSQSYTDSRESHKYNMWLSDRRAKRTVNYIISKGISPDRISGKGFGETQLVNKCSNNVPCSEDDHQANRRTEFNLIQE